MAKFDDVVDGTLDFYPLRIIRTGFEMGKGDTRSTFGKGSAAEDADMRMADDGTEASGCGDSPARPPRLRRRVAPPTWSLD